MGSDLQQPLGLEFAFLKLTRRHLDYEGGHIGLVVRSGGMSEVAFPAITLSARRAAGIMFLMN